MEVSGILARYVLVSDSIQFLSEHWGVGELRKSEIYVTMGTVKPKRESATRLNGLTLSSPGSR